MNPNYDIEEPSTGETGWGDDVSSGFGTIATQMKSSYDAAERGYRGN